MKIRKTWYLWGLGLLVSLVLWLALSEGLSVWRAGNAATLAQEPSGQPTSVLAGDVRTGPARILLPLLANRYPLNPPKIAFESVRDGNYEIYLMNPDGSDQFNLTRHPAKDAAPAWAPDGNRIAFVSDRDGNEEIYLINRDGSGIVRLTFSEYAFDGWPTWSPDGKRIAFQSDRAGRFDIFAMNADGSGLTRLTTHPAHDRWPDWSPDGTLITFTSNRNIYKKIYVMRSDGSNQRAVLDANEYWDDRYSTWAPDGRLTFVSDRPAPSDGSRDEEIYIINVGGAVQQLTDNSSDEPNRPGDWLARWSPDGTRFVFYSDRDGDFRKNVIVKVMATGAEIRLTDNSWNDEFPVWSP
jgi:Tol biopolymer transport system component